MYKILAVIIVLILITFISKELKKKKFEKMYKGFKFIHLRNGLIGFNGNEYKHVHGSKEDNFCIQQIDGYEIYTNNSTVSKGKRALVGGLTFGITGALIGSVSGKQKLKNMGVRLYINGEHIKLEFLLTECKKQSFVAHQAEDNIHEFIAQLKKTQ